VKQYLGFYCRQPPSLRLHAAKTVSSQLTMEFWSTGTSIAATDWTASRCVDRSGRCDNRSISDSTLPTVARWYWRWHGRDCGFFDAVGGSSTTFVLGVLSEHVKKHMLWFLRYTFFALYFGSRRARTSPCSPVWRTIQKQLPNLATLQRSATCHDHHEQCINETLYAQRHSARFASAWLQITSKL